jgi:hypothetical protein
MTPELFLTQALSPALRLLPTKMDSPAGRAMIVAICLQESRLKYRAQIGGPARGYAQFERGGGVVGVLTHAASKPHIQSVLAALDYDAQSDAAACYIAIEHNDILAAAFARLLLWTLPDPLPARDAPGSGWSQYLKAWRPGKPHRETWDEFYSQAWELVV